MSEGLASNTGIPEGSDEEKVTTLIRLKKQPGRNYEFLDHEKPKIRYIRRSSKEEAIATVHGVTWDAGANDWLLSVQFGDTIRSVLLNDARTKHNNPELEIALSATGSNILRTSVPIVLLTAAVLLRIYAVYQGGAEQPVAASLEKKPAREANEPVLVLYGEGMKKALAERGVTIGMQTVHLARDKESPVISIDPEATTAKVTRVGEDLVISWSFDSDGGHTEKELHISPEGIGRMNVDWRRVR